MLAAAQKFRADLRANLSLDLAKYYEFRNGSYGENWYPAPGNSWHGEKFNQTRQAAARHIMALKQFVGD